MRLNTNLRWKMTQPIHLTTRCSEKIGPLDLSLMATRNQHSCNTAYISLKCHCFGGIEVHLFYIKSKGYIRKLNKYVHQIENIGYSYPISIGVVWNICTFDTASCLKCIIMQCQCMERNDY